MKNWKGGRKGGRKRSEGTSGISCALGILLFLLFPSLGFGEKYAVDFLSIGPGARALSLGGAGVAASIYDATATYWNPAALWKLHSNALSFQHSERFSGFSTYNFVSFVTVLNKIGGFGLTWIRQGIEDIPIYPALDGTPAERMANVALQPKDEPEGYLQDVENAWFISTSYVFEKPVYLSNNLPFQVALGANVKYISQRLGQAKAKGFGLDFGVLLTSEELSAGHITFGLLVQDAFTTHIKWNTSHEDILTANFKTGIAFSPSRLNGLTVTFDLDTRYELTPHVGLEYQLFKVLSLRLGAQKREVSMGVGLGLYRFSLDYAFSRHSLANSQTVSLNAHF